MYENLKNIKIDDYLSTLYKSYKSCGDYPTKNYFISHDMYEVIMDEYNVAFETKADRYKTQALHSTTDEAGIGTAINALL